MIYTQADIDRMRRKMGAHCTIGDGCKIGDWGKTGGGCKIGYDCEIGNMCEVGDFSKIGYDCKIGDGCTVGNYCTTGDGCKIGYRCEIGDWCKIGDYSKIGDDCKIGGGCTIGDNVTLGRAVELGDQITLGRNITYEGGAVVNGHHIKIGNIGSEQRTAYWYIDEDGAISVRAGCWYGQLGEFKRRVREVHGGTIHETMYLAACDYAEVVLRAMLEAAKKETAEAARVSYATKS